MGVTDPFSTNARRTRQRSALLVGVLFIGALIAIYVLPVLSYADFDFPTHMPRLLSSADADPAPEISRRHDHRPNSMARLPETIPGDNARASSFTQPNVETGHDRSSKPAVALPSADEILDGNSPGAATSPASRATTPSTAESNESESLSRATKRTCDLLTRRFQDLSGPLCTADTTLELSNAAGSFAVIGQSVPASDNNAPRVMLVAGLDGRAGQAISTALLWGEQFRASPTGLDWLIIPAANPQGLASRRLGNTRKVYLDRNFPTPGWSTNAAMQQPSTLRDAPVNPGDRPGSEPETRAITRAIDTYHPNIIVRLTRGDGTVTINGQSSQPNAWGPLLGAYVPVGPGSLAQYATSERNIDVVTLRLPHSDSAPDTDSLSAIRTQLVDYLRDRFLATHKP